MFHNVEIRYRIRNTRQSAEFLIDIVLHLIASDSNPTLH